MPLTNPFFSSEMSRIPFSNFSLVSACLQLWLQRCTPWRMA